MSVDCLAQRIACRSVRFHSSPNPIPAWNLTDWRALHHGHELAHIEAEFCVQRERTIVESCLEETDSNEFSLGRSIQHRLHQGATNAFVLNVNMDGDRTDARNG